MSKSLKDQVADALWYLKKPGTSPDDEAKAIDILSSIAFSKPKASVELKKIQKASLPSIKGSLKGIEIALVIGHEPGGGASGERSWNIKCAKFLKRKLEKRGASVIIYYHKIRSYSARQNAMRSAVKRLQPNNKICIEFHYDAVSSKYPNGHHFQYVSTKGKLLASAFRDQWQKRYPQSRTRRGSTGIYKNTKGNGAGFLKKAPGYATLLEPFFRSNPAEWAFFKDKHEEVSSVYDAAIVQFSKH